MINCVDPEQTAPSAPSAPSGAALSGYTMFAQAYLSQNVGSLQYVIYEPCHEKTCLRGFCPDKTQTDLRSHRI